MPEIRTLNQVEQDSVHIVSVSAGEIRPMKEMENVVIYSGGLPEGGRRGDLLAKRSDANYETEWITPASTVEQDNTRPITAAAVYMEIGNINALLATI